jgi:gluconokinase
MSTGNFPSDPLLPVGGLFYFGRMLDKIRQHARGTLREDFIANIGKGMDARLCHFLHVDHAALRAFVLDGASDDQALDWCFTHGRRLHADEILIWNDFLTKRGWNDSSTPILEKYKHESGLGGRADVQTFLHYWAVDEGRTP